MKVGLFGGTFDPIHEGHVAVAVEARRRLDLERVYLLPTAVPPHKREEKRAPAYRRFAMTEIATLEEEGLWVSDVELDEEGPSYTVETLERFREALPGADLHYLLGMDSLAELPAWRRWRELPGLARIVVLERPGVSRDEVVSGSPSGIRDAIDTGRILFLDNPRWEISSTAIRNLLRAGEDPPSGWLHPRVLDYVRKYDLYDEGIPASPSP